MIGRALTPISRSLLRDLALGAGSKPFLIMTPAAAKDLAVRGLLNGIDSLRLEWRQLCRRGDSSFR